MRRLATLLFAVTVVMIYSGCQPAANTTSNTTANTNANAAKPAAAPPTADALMTIDGKAWEAWKAKDGKFFEGFLTDNFVGFGSDGKRPTKAEVVKMISEHKCDVKSHALSDAKVTPAGADVAVLTYKATVEGTCEGKPIPSPVTAVSVFVRSGDTWKGAYHNEVAITDPKNMKPPPPPPAKDAEKKDAAKPADANANTAAAPAADPLTDAILAVEKAGWEAWKAKDAKKLEEVTHKDLTFVDIFGKVTSGQAETIKMWVEGKCDVKAVDVTDAKASSLNATTAILTYKGHAEGTCDGQPLFDLWGTTVAVKDGDKWRAVYIFETPMM